MNVRVLPVVALRGLVMFPGTVMNFEVGRDKTVAAVKSAAETDGLVFMVSQIDEYAEDFRLENLHKIGVIAKIKQTVKGRDGVVKVVAEGICRANAVGYQDIGRYMLADVEKVPVTKEELTEVQSQAYLRNIQALFDEILALVPRIPKEIIKRVHEAQDPFDLADYIAANVLMSSAEKQQYLDEGSALKRLELILQLLDKECEIVALEIDINERVQSQVDHNRREFFLREQLKTIQNELQMEEAYEEEDGYVEKIKALKLSPESEEKLLKEVKRLERMPESSQEAALIQNYLDCCLDLPWNTETKEKTDLKAAEKILDHDHYGLEKVKKRILEYLAVRQLGGTASAQILCLAGPPGVGKTSVASSVARAMGRTYVRVALGGVKDESDIRGHRKTYIGSMPGRIMQAIAQAKCKNPLILLDEVDKMGNDYKGDPSSALLEVLDPEQNKEFVDHFIDLPFDLSKVMFITTANDVNEIPAPLYDRMDILELPSYTREEKFHIAKQHLVKKQMIANGLTAKDIRFTDKALYLLIDSYTREAGVRSLERRIADVCRKVAVEMINGKTEKHVINEKEIPVLLGPEKYEPETVGKRDLVGVVTGLAWTSVGGETLEVEVAALKGTGKLELTGSLGDVMKESAKAAITCVRSIGSRYGVPEDFYKEKDIHIHFPEGAVPKDGPSAGIAITTAIVSALSGRPVRREVAMTGEITLTGRVLPIGGLKEKTMAAYRYGIRTVILPEKNKKDLQEIDATVKEHLNFVFADHIETVLQHALAESPKSKKFEMKLPDKTLTACI